MLVAYFPPQNGFYFLLLYETGLCKKQLDFIQTILIQLAS